MLERESTPRRGFETISIYYKVPITDVVTTVSSGSAILNSNVTIENMALPYRIGRDKAIHE